MMRSLRILLALLLLIAQQTALAHAVAHLGGHGLPVEQKILCDQHDALGTVTGALNSAVAAGAGALPADFPFPSEEQSSVSTPGPAPSSRGPPALL